MTDQTAVPTYGPTNREREPQCATQQLIVHLVAGDLAAISSLRRLARTELTAWAVVRDRIDDILVVLSELATNALVHTDGPAQIRVERQSARILLHVTDAEATLPDFGTTPETEAEGGYGLACIAAALADEITASPVQRGRGKTVTAAFSVPE